MNLFKKYFLNKQKMSNNSNRAAFLAATKGNVYEICRLRKLGYNVTPDGATWAVADGNMEIVLNLFENNIKPTLDAADVASGENQIEMLHYLWEHEYISTSMGANWAAGEGHLNMLQELRIKKKVYPTSKALVDKLNLLKIAQELSMSGWRNYCCDKKELARLRRETLDRDFLTNYLPDYLTDSITPFKIKLKIKNKKS